MPQTLASIKRYEVVKLEASKPQPGTPVHVPMSFAALMSAFPTGCR